MAKDAEAYNKKHGKQEGKKCETEMVDEGMIHLPNEKYGKNEMELYYKLGCPVLCSNFRVKKKLVLLLSL